MPVPNPELGANRWGNLFPQDLRSLASEMHVARNLELLLLWFDRGPEIIDHDSFLGHDLAGHFVVGQFRVRRSCGFMVVRLPFGI